MLSRTAFHLFWIGRHLERAETAARLLDVGARITLIPSNAARIENEWESLLRASGTADAFHEKYGEITQETMESFMFFDRCNPASFASCLEKAREGGRVVRTALTSQVWDALNTAYQKLRKLEALSREARDSATLTDFAMRHTATIRGAIAATQLRNDGWRFLNLGYDLERADATARMLDVKYFVLLPRVEFIGSGLDSYQWQVLLRALSAHRAFNWAYGGEITATKVAEFLILNPESPRSLMSALIEAEGHLSGLVARYGPGVPSLAHEAAQRVLEDLQSHDIERIFEDGLHEFLSWFIGEIALIADAVQDDYLSGRT
ncbi:alpha-E domain-containing protein [Paracoccus aminophilus]|uniref:DUF403 domain-containing protein n=1 Tax=Paracoccus aminophilus JCM 7686 TaxID=1367847 RepID=S5YFC9_PARAH|nr:alpha-E domain-containing protein [Paracoccus aminophilus]AGT10183.1 hypothetical protein JCM7686_3147 [Paracoccus aminophilus JCM 7686]